MANPLYGSNKADNSLNFIANSQIGDAISMVDADKVISAGDLEGAITLVTVDTAASAARTLTIPDATQCAKQQIDVLYAVASDGYHTVVEASAGYMLGAVLAQNGTGTTIVQSDGTDTKITINDDIEPGTRLSFYSNGTNWICSGTVLSADADPAFS